MALPKRTKEGGVKYKGYKVDVLSASGEYVIAIIPSTTHAAVNAVSITPDSAGANDTFALAHYKTTGTSGGVLVKQIATNVYNIGGGQTIMLDFAAMQMLDPGDSLRFTYLNTASQAMPIFITVESIG